MAPGWQAALALGFELRAGRTVLARQRHHGPLVVQRPLYPEGDLCHVIVVHPPGGVVAGDDLHLDVAVGSGAQALLTAPAAGKFYRSQGATARWRQQLRVEGGGLEWLPQENIYYPGARVDLALDVHLAGAARFFGWEIGCFGLPARAAAFTGGRVHQRIALHLDGRCLLCERQLFDAAAIAAPWGLAGAASVGSLAVYPADDTALEAVRALAPAGVLLGATLLDDLLVCRARAAQAGALRAAFVAIWQALRPAWGGRAAQAPRIWAT